jgi:hypothetical protein
MHEPIPCPQCGAPAQITERFRLGSTAGPVEHVKTGCVNNHWLTPWPRWSRGPGQPYPVRSRRRCLPDRVRRLVARSNQPQRTTRP